MTVPYQTKVIKAGNLMPTFDIGYDWLKINSQPIKPKFSDSKTDDEIIILKNENEALQREVQHQKQTLVNYQNNVSLYTDDYKRLDIDFKNSIHENRQLQAQINKYEDTERLNVILMKQVIELKKQLEEKE